MGYSIRTDEWRLTVWLPFNTSLFIANFSVPPIAIELYDHRNATIVFDFDNDGEVENVASDPQYASIIAELSAQLQRQYTWPLAWLIPARQAMLKGQLSQDAMDGFYPYSSGNLPVPPDHD